MAEAPTKQTSLVDLLPPALRQFLDAGGWWLVVGLVGVTVLLVVRLAGTWFPRRKVAAKRGRPDLAEDLADHAPPNLAGEKARLTVYHLPVRLRLAVLAQAGKETRLRPETAARILDRVVPGLGDLAVRDQVCIRIWPPQLSQQGFVHAFQRLMRRPDPEGQPSHWILVAGPAHLGRPSVLVGLALWAEQPATLGRVTLEPYQWLDVLRIKDAKQ
jgi:hypothetical protein